MLDQHEHGAGEALLATRQISQIIQACGLHTGNRYHTVDVDARPHEEHERVRVAGAGQAAWPMFDDTVQAWGHFPRGAAHRGGAAEAHANSLEAVDLTAALGFWMETDVVVDMAEVPVLLHPKGPARLLTHRRLRRVRSSPKLADVLAHYPDLPMMIDVKHWPAVQPTAAALAHADAVDRVVIGTFSARRTAATVAAIRLLTGKQVRTALTLREMLRLAFGRGGSLTANGPRLIQIPERLATRSFIARAHRFGIWTVAWTVDDERRMVELFRDGIDIVMTDRPSRLARILGDHGLR